MLVPLLLAASSAHAFQSPTSGPTVEVGVGGGYAGFHVAASAHASLGWWFGRYDDDYALGRFTALVLTPRLDLSHEGPVLTGLFEVRRALDLFVLAPHYLVAAGPLYDGEAVGFAGRIGAGLKFRRTPRFGFVARVEFGVDVLDDRVDLALVTTVGIGWSARRKGAR